MATLLYSLASPYARVPRVIHRVLGLSNISEVLVNPFDNPDALIKANPLSKIPCLILNDKTFLFDSEVISRYFDTMYGEHQLFGVNNDWQRATDFSLAKGLMDSAVGLRQEQMREEEGVRSVFWTKRFETAVLRTVEHIENQLPTFYSDDAVTAERIVLICALNYLDFRQPQLGWEQHAPQLAQWLGNQLSYSFFEDTAPK